MLIRAERLSNPRYRGEEWGPNGITPLVGNARVALGAVPGDCGDLQPRASVSPSGSERRAQVTLGGQAWPHLFIQPKRALPWMVMLTFGRKRRIFLRKRPNRPRWTRTGCGVKAGVTEAAGAHLWDPTSGAPQSGPRTRLHPFLYHLYHCSIRATPKLSGSRDPSERGAG